MHSEIGREKYLFHSYSWCINRWFSWYIAGVWVIDKPNSNSSEPQTHTIIVQFFFLVFFFFFNCNSMFFYTLRQSSDLLCWWYQKHRRYKSNQVTWWFVSTRHWYTADSHVFTLFLFSSQFPESNQIHTLANGTAFDADAVTLGSSASWMVKSTPSTQPLDGYRINCKMYDPIK